MNRGEVTSRQTQNINQFCVSKYMCAFWPKKEKKKKKEQPAPPEHMNAVLEHFMALQKYLLIFKTQYQTPRMNFMNKKVQYN